MGWGMSNINELLKIIISGYIFVFILYYILSKDIDDSDLVSFSLRLLPIFVLVAIPLYFLSAQSMIVIILCGVFNMLTFPLLNYLTKKKANITFHFPYDFAFGVYIVAFLASLQVLGHIFFTNNFIVILLSFLESCLLMLPLVEMIYYRYYGENFSWFSALAILGTNRQEVKEYFKNISKIDLILNLLVLFGVFILVAFTNAMFVYSSNISNTTAGVILAILIFSGYYLWIRSKALYKKIGIYVIYSAAKDYYDKSKAFLADYEGKYEKLQVKSDLEGAIKGTTIIIIGESANRLHMSAFSNYERETTPWLSAQHENKDFFLFPNAYSTWTQTVPTLEMALTEKNQYNDKNFAQAYSFIDIAKKSGFKTWWYSNQGYIGNDDTPISLVASTADEHRWVVQDYLSVQHDETLLHYLKRVTPTQNNFVVLHLKGSHSNFHSRYPDNFVKWQATGNSKIIAEYDNSILYTDFVLEKIYTYAKMNLNLQAMLYFSDHGLEVKRKRMPGFIGFENLRIPFFVYLSEDYQKRFPETAKALASHEKAYFTNDLVYDLICGILQIKSAHYSAQCDISSPLYNFNQSKLRTNLGKTSLEKDNYRQSVKF